MASTISEVANKLSNVLTRWSNLLDNLGDWSNSTSDEVTFTKPNGETFTVSSLSHILDEVEGPAATAVDARDAAQVAEGDAQTAETGAQSAESTAQTHRDDAQAAETNALKHRDDAQNSANVAKNAVQKRYPSDSKMRIPKPLTVVSTTTGSAGTFCWDDDFIYLKTNNGWRKVPLETL